MNLPLSYLLPAHNAERQLADNVQRLVEMLPELSPEFEILIVDDGSIDDTADVAAELSRFYPQVWTISNNLRYGQAAVEQLGLRRTRGELVLVQDGARIPHPKELIQLWQLRHDPGLVVAVGRERRLTAGDRKSLRIDAGGPPLAPSTALSGGLKIIRRSAIQQLGAGGVPRHHLQVKRIVV